jgi:hypothetical protein
MFQEHNASETSVMKNLPSHLVVQDIVIEVLKPRNDDHNTQNNVTDVLQKQRESSQGGRRAACPLVRYHKETRHTDLHAASLAGRHVQFM